MKNFGLARLTLVDPQTCDWRTARHLAVSSGEIVDQAPRIESLSAAIAEARWVVGTSVRSYPGQRGLSPTSFAEEAVSRTEEGDVALVFGGEKSGLSNDDLRACHDVSTIPTSGDLASLNLAQAVLLYAYELFQASLELAPAFATDTQETRPTEGELAELEVNLRCLIERTAFADLDRPRHGVADLAHTLRRSGLTSSELRLWQAALHHIRRIAGGG
jgi:TrmH family RNA methyltransferase